MEKHEIVAHLNAAKSGLSELAKKNQAEIDAFFTKQQEGLPGPFFDNPTSVYTLYISKLNYILANFDDN